MGVRRTGNEQNKGEDGEDEQAEKQQNLFLLEHRALILQSALSMDECLSVCLCVCNGQREGQL